jgi:hypothetical protein
VRCNATAIFDYNLVRMLMFDGKAILRYFVIIILYCKQSTLVVFFQQDTFFIIDVLGVIFF